MFSVHQYQFWSAKPQIYSRHIFLHCILQSYYVYFPALKTSVNCPHQPKLYDQLPEYTAVRVGAE